jgi:toxin HigB-1
LEVRFADASLERVEADADYDGGLSRPLVKAFRKRMQYIRNALDERDFYKMKSLRFEKLEGKRQHQHSMRLNDQWRLITEFEGQNPKKTLVIVGIEDYH